MTDLQSGNVIFPTTSVRSWTRRVNQNEAVEEAERHMHYYNVYVRDINTRKVCDVTLGLKRKKHQDSFTYSLFNYRISDTDENHVLPF